MVAWHRKMLRWVIAGGAFVGVLAITGCSSLSTTDSPSPSIGPEAKTEQPANQPAILAADPNGGADGNDDATTASDAPQVNIFGEFNGVTRGRVRSRGNGGFQQHTFIDEGYDGDVSIDPTGKWMVFTSTRDNEHPNLYMQRVDGMSVVQITNDEADYAFPVFSPDSKHVACSSTRGGNWDIYVMDTDGKNVIQITSGTMQCMHPSFSPDGTRLVYCGLGGKSGQWELWTVDLTTGEKRMIGFGLFPSWSPSKTLDRIAFQRARQRGSRWFNLWTLDLVEGEARQVTEVAASTNAAIVAPTWNPDGKQLAFATIAEPTGDKSVKSRGQEDIWTVNCDGTSRHRVTDGIGMNLSPFWSADNRIYFISDRGGAECVWSYGADSPRSRVAAKPAMPDAPAAADAVGSTDPGNPQ
jgi:TolB protein